MGRSTIGTVDVKADRIGLSSRAGTALLAHDIMIFTQLLTLGGEHRIAGPKRLRYRILHKPVVT